MIDIHSHVLPLADDGSSDMQESLAMIRQSAESGVKILAVTPHANQKGRFENYYRENLKQQFRRLKAEVQAAGIPIRLVVGMEIYSSPDLEELLDNRLFVGLNCTDYYLVEFPFTADTGLIYHGIDMIFNAGGIPVIAHPERYTQIQKNPSILYDWIQEGVCTQVNKGSIFGGFGSGAKKTADYLYSHDLVTCVGSDAHGVESRTTDMSQLREYLLENYGQEYMRKITRDNPFLMLNNKDVPTHGRR
ncbi:MAG: hypothetical protein Q4B85_11815 [Lachnospiraceae bacterium]|nr:hypothetical protein [Lachnospiraceae bacterium]